MLTEVWLRGVKAVICFGGGSILEKTYTRAFDGAKIKIEVVESDNDDYPNTFIMYENNKEVIRYQIGK